MHIQGEPELVVNKLVGLDHQALLDEHDTRCALGAVADLRADRVDHGQLFRFDVF